MAAANTALMNIFIKKVIVFLKQISLKQILLFIALGSLFPFMLYWKWKLWRLLRPSKRSDYAYLDLFYRKFNKVAAKEKSETLQEYFRKLQQTHIDTHALTEMLEYTYRIKFHDEDRNKQKEKQFIKTIKALARTQSQASS